MLDYSLRVSALTEMYVFSLLAWLKILEQLMGGICVLQSRSYIVLWPVCANLYLGPLVSI